MVATLDLQGNFDVERLRADAGAACRTAAIATLIPFHLGLFVAKTHLTRGSYLDDVGSDQAGIGGARSRAIRLRICPNMRAGTATSVIWKVT